MEEKNADYRRTLDVWTKVMYIAVPILGVAAIWGAKTTSLAAIQENSKILNDIMDKRISKMELILENQQQYNLVKAQTDSRTLEQQVQMNNRLQRIESILDRRSSK